MQFLLKNALFGKMHFFQKPEFFFNENLDEDRGWLIPTKSCVSDIAVLPMQ